MLSRRACSTKDLSTVKVVRVVLAIQSRYHTVVETRHPAEEHSQMRNPRLPS